MNDVLRVAVLAGEPSGDKLGAALLKGLNAERDCRILGVGGPLMIEEGLESLYPMSDFAIMGLVEVLPKVPMLLRRIKDIAARLDAHQPDVLITIDSPDFTLRVAKKLKSLRPDLTVVHYVAPSVWAWRPERADKMAAHVDHVLTLLPFEPPYMEKAGMGADFVGHPAMDAKQPLIAEKSSLAAALGLEADKRTLCLLPGSRKGEIKRMLPIFKDIAARLDADQPTQFILPMGSAVAEYVLAEVNTWDQNVATLDPRGMAGDTAEARKRTAFALSDLAIANSGTVSLELAATQTLMVIAYQANWLTTRMVKRMALIDTANLINITTQTRTVPEFLFERCTADDILKGALDLLNDPEKRAAQSAASKATVEALTAPNGDQGAYAAKAVLKLLG